MRVTVGYCSLQKVTTSGKIVVACNETINDTPQLWSSKSVQHSCISVQNMRGTLPGQAGGSSIQSLNPSLT